MSRYHVRWYTITTAAGRDGPRRPCGPPGCGTAGQAAQIEFAAARADADLLVVCGTPGPGLDAAIERVWSQVPAPRARADILSADVAGDELDRARDRIHDRSG